MWSGGRHELSQRVRGRNYFFVVYDENNAFFSGLLTIFAIINKTVYLSGVRGFDF